MSVDRAESKDERSYEDEDYQSPWFRQHFRIVVHKAESTAGERASSSASNGGKHELAPGKKKEVAERSKSSSDEAQFLRLTEENLKLNGKGRFRLSLNDRV